MPRGTAGRLAIIATQVDTASIEDEQLFFDPITNYTGVNGKLNPTFPLDVIGSVNSDTGYYINGSAIVTGNSLGPGILNAQLTYNNSSAFSTNGTFNANGDISILDSIVLTEDTLGTGIINSSLTTLGTLDQLIVSSANNPVASFTQTDVLNNCSIKLTHGVYNSYFSTSNTGDTNINNYNTDKTINFYTTNIGGNTKNITFTSDGDIDLVDGDQYLISGNEVLTSNTLGTLVINSSLTNLGTLDNLTVTGEITSNSGITVETSNTNNLEIKQTVGTKDNNIVLQNTADNNSVYLQLDQWGNYNVKNNNISKAINLYTTNSGGTTKNVSITSDGDIDLIDGDQYLISGNEVLTLDTLGTGVINSSLTSVGTLNSLNVTGDLDVDSGTLKVDSTNNRVGVGVPNPSFPLHVWGDINTSTQYCVGGNVVLSSDTIGTGVINSSLTNLGTLDNLTVTGDITCDTNTFIVDSTNNRVGINISNPSFPLHVIGDVNSSTQYKVGGNSVLSSNTLGSLVVNSSLKNVGTLDSLTVTGDVVFDIDTFVVDSINNRVGFGDSTPDHKVHIKETDSGLETTPLFIQNDSNTDNTAVAIGFGAGTSDTDPTGKIAHKRLSTNDRGFSFQTWNGTLNEQMNLNGAGDLTIGRSIKIGSSSYFGGLTTAEINALSNPQNGDMAFSTTINRLCIYSVSVWKKIALDGDL